MLGSCQNLAEATSNERTFPTSWSLYACSQLLAFYDITIVNRKNPLGTLGKQPDMDDFVVVDLG